MKKIAAFFNELIKNSFFIKVISVLIAIGVWLYIINVADPVSSKEFTNVPISFIYEGTVPYNNSLMPLVTNRNFNVDIRVSGSRTSLLNFSKDKISASLNFNAVAAEGIYEVPISISLEDENLTYDIIGSDSITLEFVKKSSTTIKVDFQRIGNYKSGYSVVEQTVSPDTITIEGPKSIIDTISYAEVLLDVSDASKNIVEVSDISILTADRAYVDRTFLTLSDSQATVSVALQYKKSVKVTTTLVNPYGGDESAYATVSYSPSPYLQLQGDEDTLSLIDAYNIGTINLSEITGTSKTFDFNIQNQDGISVVSDSKKVSVTVDLGKARTKNFRLSSQVLSKCTFLNVPDNVTPKITDTYKTITVRAQDYTLGELSADSFKLSVDLSSIPNEDGDYPLIIELPAGVSGGFMNRYYVSVSIEDND